MNLLEYIKNPVTGNDVLQSAVFSIVDNGERLISIQESQWDEGINKFGNTIGEYSQRTQEIAQLENPNKPKIAGQPYNLDYTGDLRDKTFMQADRVSGDVVVTIDSDSPNKEKLFRTINNKGFVKPETVFGYKPDNMDKFTRLVTTESLKKLKSRIT